MMLAALHGPLDPRVVKIGRCSNLEGFRPVRSDGTNTEQEA